MSDDHGTRPAAVRHGLLTPEASAITAFTLAVLSMTGQGLWTQFAQVFFGDTFRPDQYLSVLATAGLSSLALSAAAVLLARRVVVAPAAPVAPWAGHLARAAFVVGLVGAALSALVVLGGLVLHL